MEYPPCINKEDSECFKALIFNQFCRAFDENRKVMEKDLKQGIENLRELLKLYCCKF